MCPPQFLSHLQHRFQAPIMEGSASPAVTSPGTKRTITYNRIVDLTHTLSPDFPSYNGYRGR